MTNTHEFHGNQYQEIKQPQHVGIVIAAATLILIGVVYIQITIVVGLTLGALYGIKTIYLQPKPVATVEAPTEAEKKPKRNYQHRLTVNHYQNKKPVKV